MAVLLVGVADLRKGLADLTADLAGDEAGQAFAGAAVNLAKRVRMLAPKGEHPNYTDAYGPKPPGRLRSAVIGRVFKASSRKRFGPGAYAMVKLGRRFSVKAPYALIVESGRKALSIIGQGKTKRAKVFHFRDAVNYQWFTKKVRGFTGRNFFRRAIDQAGDQELTGARDRLAKYMDKKAARKP